MEGVTEEDDLDELSASQYGPPMSPQRRLPRKGKSAKRAQSKAAAAVDDEQQDSRNAKRRKTWPQALTPGASTNSKCKTGESAEARRSTSKGRHKSSSPTMPDQGAQPDRARPPRFRRTDMYRRAVEHDELPSLDEAISGSSSNGVSPVAVPDTGQGSPAHALDDTDTYYSRSTLLPVSSHIDKSPVAPPKASSALVPTSEVLRVQPAKRTQTIASYFHGSRPQSTGSTSTHLHTQGKTSSKPAKGLKPLHVKAGKKRGTASVSTLYERHRAMLDLDPELTFKPPSESDAMPTSAPMPQTSLDEPQPSQTGICAGHCSQEESRGEDLPPMTATTSTTAAQTKSVRPLDPAQQAEVDSWMQIIDDSFFDDDMDVDDAVASGALDLSDVPKLSEESVPGGFAVPPQSDDESGHAALPPASVTSQRADVRMTDAANGDKQSLSPKSIAGPSPTERGRWVTQQAAERASTRSGTSARSQPPLTSAQFGPDQRSSLNEHGFGSAPQTHGSDTFDGPAAVDEGSGHSRSETLDPHLQNRTSTVQERPVVPLVGHRPALHVRRRPIDPDAWQPSWTDPAPVPGPVPTAARERSGPEVLETHHSTALTAEGLLDFVQAFGRRQEKEAEEREAEQERVRREVEGYQRRIAELEDELKRVDRPGI